MKSFTEVILSNVNFGRKVFYKELDKKLTTVPYKGDETCPWSHGHNLNHIYLTHFMMLQVLLLSSFYCYCYYKVFITNCRQFLKIRRKNTSPITQTFQLSLFIYFFPKPVSSIFT